MADNVVYRNACHEDFPALLEIGDVYKGTDYLYSIYHELLDDPGVVALVADIGGKAIGFACFQLFDGGETANGRGGRIHPAYRNHGILPILLKKTTEACVEKLWKKSGFKRISIKHNDFVHPKIAKREGLSEKLRRREISLKYCAGQVNWRSAAQFQRVYNIKKLTPDDLRSVFHCCSLLDRVLPHGIFLNRNKGYRPMEANIPLMISDRTAVCASFVPNDENQSMQKEYSSFSTNEQKNIPNKNPIFVDICSKALSKHKRPRMLLYN